MGGVFLKDEIKKDLNRIRPHVKVYVLKGKRGLTYSDIIGVLIQFWKENKK